jgi:hypothetical protein
MNEELPSGILTNIEQSTIHKLVLIHWLTDELIQLQFGKLNQSTIHKLVNEFIS